MAKRICERCGDYGANKSGLCKRCRRREPTPWELLESLPLGFKFDDPDDEEDASDSAIEIDGFVYHVDFGLHVVPRERMS